MRFPLFSLPKLMPLLRRHGTVIALVIAVLGIASFTPDYTRTSAKTLVAATTPVPQVASLPSPSFSTPAPVTAPTPAAIPTPAPVPQWDKEVTVRSGDTLSSILKRAELFEALPALLRSGKVAKPLHRLHQGQVLRLRKDADGLSHLVLQRSPSTELHYRREAQGTYSMERVELAVEARRRTTQGTITQSLFQAGQDAGLSAPKILELADIFLWDIDFALDVRAGDRFTLVWDEHWVRNEHVEDGPILAAEFVNRGRSYRALRYLDAKGNAHYYTPEGEPMRKLFLRTPVDFTRISSHFSRARLHPILKVVRPHRGVDYAAPIGAKVYATGDGVITHRGRKGQYGRVIFIRHGTRYTTVYAHLSKYAPGLRVGSRVKQGQYIGRVGQSGMATGPHLHYEFRIDGVHRNPLSVTMPKPRPLPASEQTRFKEQTHVALHALEQPLEPPAAYANLP